MVRLIALLALQDGNAPIQYLPQFLVCLANILVLMLTLAKFVLLEKCVYRKK